ncbi:MAG: hypothetical protein AAGF15_10090 [Pseudomonadota bacterium]
MSGRDDIQPSATSGWRRLSYTRHCGWVDWGHALPGSAQSLKMQLDHESAAFGLLDGVTVTLDGRPAYLLNYGQAMGNRLITVSATRQWVVVKGLTRAQKESVGLAIFLSASHQFETMQGTFPYSLLTNSGYSAEDLVSNLIGFYSAFRNISQSDMRQTCGEVSVAESERIWDEHLPNGLESIKNTTTEPIYYPTEEGGSGPPTFPPLFREITPAPKGVLWTTPQSRFIDGRLVNRGAHIDVSAAGRVTARD